MRSPMRLSIKRLCDILFVLLGAALLCFLAWKCRFGFANNDEAFYLTIPWRLCQGDGLFAHEWHLSQMSGFLLLPFVYVYRLLRPGAEGIFLTFRYVCLAVQAICCSYSYIRLRRISPVGALLSSLFLLIYIPFSIMALSYNSMGIFLMVVCLSTLVTNENGRLADAFAGLAFAGAVLCCPYLILVYGIYTVVILIAPFLRSRSSFKEDKNDSQRNPRRSSRQSSRRKKDDTSFFHTYIALPSVRRWFFFTVGAAALALVFAVFVLSRASISDILRSFPAIFQDTEHPHTPFVRQLKTYVDDLLSVNPYAPYIYLTLLAIFLSIIFDRKRRDHKAVYASLATAVVIFFLWTLYCDKDGFLKYINCLMFPINLLAPFCLMLSENSDAKKIYDRVVVPGMLYSVCISYASNQHFLAISSASSAALPGSVLMVVLLCQELKEDMFNKKQPKRGVKPLHLVAITLAGVLFCTQLYYQIDLRYKSVFWEVSIKLQTATIDEGPEKGLYVSQSAKALHDQMKEEADVIRALPETESVFFFLHYPWMYFFCPQMRMGGYSAWLGGNYDFASSRLDNFYSIYPEKIPDAIFMEASCEDIANHFIEEYGYSRQQTPNDNILLTK